MYAPNCKKVEEESQLWKSLVGILFRGGGGGQSVFFLSICPTVCPVMHTYQAMVAGYLNNCKSYSPETW